MFAVFYVCLLFLCLRSSAAEAELAPPQDLTMITLNTNYTLSWTWDQSAAESKAVTFTTQYVSRYKLKQKKGPKWRTACEETSYMSCDLTGLNLNYLSIFMLRVRANENGRHSQWANKEFCPDKEAAVGPPSRLLLRPSGSGLDVFISDPLSSSNSSMKEHLPKLYYNIVYWEQADQRQVQSLTSEVTLVTLSDLKAWTWYCVSVQTRDDFYNKSSSFTTPQCVQNQGWLPWWQIFLYFLVSLVICFLLVLLSIYCSHQFYHFCKAALFPHDQLPSHFKQPIFDSPGSDNRRLVISDSESELLSDHVIVCPLSSVLEIHNSLGFDSEAPPALLEEDSSCRHSRQHSNSSVDSGVYSAGGNSSGLQPSVCPSSTDVAGRFKACSDSEQVKMLKLEPELKIFSVIADEGVSDVCV